MQDCMFGLLYLEMDGKNEGNLIINAKIKIGTNNKKSEADL